MNMFKVLLELQKVGFDGCVNPDHIPPIEGDSEGPSHGLAYSIGYIRALLAAIAALP
jgi:mannonate dehydratase